MRFANSCEEEIRRMNRREFFKKNLVAGATLGMGLFPLPDRAEDTQPGAALRDDATFVPEYFGSVDLASAGSLLKVGFAERDITPDIGMQMAGDYVPAFVKGFHDRCKVRAAIFDDGRMPVVLVGLDTLVAPDSVVKAAREQIHARCGITAQAVMIGAAHNHSGGPVAIVQPHEYDGAPEFVRHLAYDESSMADEGYLDNLATQIANAVCEAYENCIEACCGSATGIEDKVAFSRRFLMKNGLTYTHPGQGNPDIMKPMGPIDPQVGVLGAWTQEGRLLGCVVNYTCHATTNPGDGLQASANWVYYMERVIRGAMGAEVPVVFLQGAAGNVTQVDNLRPYKYPQNTPWAEFVGGRVGAEAVKTLLSIVPGTMRPLEARSTVLHIPRRTPSPEHVRKAYEIVKRGKPENASQAEWVFSKEIILLDYKVKKSPVVPVEIQAIQIGSVVFISNPAELFCQAGLDIKAASSFPQTCVVAYANGAAGYVPTAVDLGQHGGGYEAHLSSYTNLDESASAQIVKASSECIGQLRPGMAAEPEKHAAFLAGPQNAKGLGPNLWDYGDNPPELE
jgi:neutral ceramidase